MQWMAFAQHWRTIMVCNQPDGVEHHSAHERSTEDWMDDWSSVRAIQRRAFKQLSDESKEGSRGRVAGQSIDRWSDKATECSSHNSIEPSNDQAAGETLHKVELRRESARPGQSVEKWDPSHTGTTVTRLAMMSSALATRPSIVTKSLDLKGEGAASGLDSQAYPLVNTSFLKTCNVTGVPRKQIKWQAD